MLGIMLSLEVCSRAASREKTPNPSTAPQLNCKLNYLCVWQCRGPSQWRMPRLEVPACSLKVHPTGHVGFILVFRPETGIATRTPTGPTRVTRLLHRLFPLLAQNVAQCHCFCQPGHYTLRFLKLRHATDEPFWRRCFASQRTPRPERAHERNNLTC